MSLELSPEAFRQLGYQVIDILAEQLASFEDGPARRALTDSQRQQLIEQPLPETPQSPADLIQ